ncbi:MAG TPA: DUF6335 family protein [Anaerolineales bacterium]|nr:DUF6335 family protein [Anaerolineales bacterium]
MATKKKKQKGVKAQKIEPPERDEPIDPYTGEVEPPAEGAYKIVEISSHGPGNREGENYLLEEEDSLDKLALDANADAVSASINTYTDDEDIKEDFQERQGLASGGRQKLKEKLNEHNFQDPSLSGGDVDAAWETSVVSGEESVGGSVPTPDQDNVDELGEAAGVTYQDDEPLNSDRKILERDRHRWELNPASADDRDEESDEE